MRRVTPLLAAFVCALPIACNSDAATSVDSARAKTIVKSLHVPWGIAFLPNGSALVSERTTGRILRVPKGGGKAKSVMKVPGVATDRGEGGLLGIALSPKYSKNRLVYAYVTTETDNRILRFKLGGQPKPILTGLEASSNHNGGRIAFGPDGKLYAGVGDATDTANAQDLDSMNGKILRMNPDGSRPADNPFPDSLVWSYGHRNVQGLAWDRSGRLWATEFGQNTRDELNLIRKGRNYGWPNVEGRGSTEGGKYTNPKVTWSTSEASPSGVAFARGRLYVGALQCQCVWRVPLHGTKAGKPRKLIADRYGRIRTVARAPGGKLWVTTSNRDGRGSPRKGDDRIVRIPAS